MPNTQAPNAKQIPNGKSKIGSPLRCRCPYSYSYSYSFTTKLARHSLGDGGNTKGTKPDSSLAAVAWLIGALSPLDFICYSSFELCHCLSPLLCGNIRRHKSLHLRSVAPHRRRRAHCAQSARSSSAREPGGRCAQDAHTAPSCSSSVLERQTRAQSAVSTHAHHTETPSEHALVPL